MNQYDQDLQLLYYNSMQAMRQQYTPGIAPWREPEAEKPNLLLLLETEE